MNYEELIGIDDEEYTFISEKFEIMTPEDTKELPRYILSTRKQNLRRLINLAIDAELDEITGRCIKEKYFLGLPVTKIAENIGQSRYNVYRYIDRGTKKLYSMLKYAYFCGFSLINPPENLEDLIMKSKKEA